VLESSDGQTPRRAAGGLAQVPHTSPIENGASGRARGSLAESHGITDASGAGERRAMQGGQSSVLCGTCSFVLRPVFLSTAPAPPCRLGASHLRAVA
jgi:hypothetical protein